MFSDLCSLPIIQDPNKSDLDEYVVKEMPKKNDPRSQDSSVYENPDLFKATHCDNDLSERVVYSSISHRSHEDRFKESWICTSMLGSFTRSKQGGYFAQDASLNYKITEAKMWSGTNGFSSIKAVNGELEDTDDLTRGPLRHCKNIPLSSSAKKEHVGLSLNRYQFISEDSQMEYSNHEVLCHQVIQ
ncbi:hypothetical protein POM88_050421 [Heracleum sosnowskyi]|uniref:Uncharacterized protein n=1 Tax=Heracleum sosnowskyi TaxID=360622 RepID=A0AAD8M0D4_9APIA|nr:hypothetical protein POM88_050421 [Heracleum sosnowskyi]